MYIEDVFREKLLAANAAGKYPETCRTRKSSLRALMVLYGVRTGEQTVASLDYVRWRGSSLIGLPLFIRFYRILRLTIHFTFHYAIISENFIMKGC